MIVEPKVRGFICTTAHPAGCFKNVEEMALAASAEGHTGPRPKKALVLGCSGGYGLASRAVLAFALGARTIGVSFERAPTQTRTASAGYYCNRAFDRLAAERGIPSRTIEGDAFSNDVKDQAVEAIRALCGGEKIDLLVYSVAAPKRTDPVSGVTYSSAIKPVGSTYHSKTVDFHTGEVTDAAIEPATLQEIEGTIRVMGGDDWRLWIDRLAAEGLLAEDFATLAYSYIGPALTHPIYKDGAIGRAKDDLLAAARDMTRAGKTAYVAVNKGLVTQASSAIPVVPLYISLLYKVMKDKGLHEGCYQQMRRLFLDKIYAGGDGFADAERRIRMDDWEMRDDVQAEIARLWPLVETGNIAQLADLPGYREDFFAIFGFGRADVDYGAEVGTGA